MADGMDSAEEVGISVKSRNSEQDSKLSGILVKSRHSDPDQEESELSPSSSPTVESGDPPPSNGNQWVLEQRRNGRYCDILIHATINCEPAGPDPGSQPINAHKIILGQVSPFFAHALSASDESMHEFIINGIDKSTLEYLIDYIYTRQMGPLSEASVFMIYTGAQMLLLESVMTECIRYIESTTIATNAVINWLFGEIHSVELANYASGYILSNLEQVSETEGFCNLTAGKLLELIRIANNTDFCSSQDMLLATINWLKHSVEERRDIISEVMSEIPLNLINLETLRCWFREDEIIKKIHSCVELYYETIEKILFEQKRRERETLPLPLPLKIENSCSESPVDHNEQSNNKRRPRRVESEEHSGIDDSADTSSRTSLDCHPDSTENLPQHDPLSVSVPQLPSQEIIPLRRRTASLEPASPAKRMKSSSKKKSRKSGFTKSKNKQVLPSSFDLVQDQAPCSSSTSISPTTVCATHAYNRNPTMYFICGDKQSKTRKIMFYDFKSKRCEKLVSYPFTQERSCLVYHRGSIYDIGGRAKDKAYIRVKIFDLVTEGWRKNPIPTLAEKRSDFNCAILDDCIYAVGGSDSHGGINCVEKLPPPVKGKSWLWEEVEYMQRARDNCGVCVYEGKVYAVGGYVAESEQFAAQMVISDSVECYDPALDKWTFKCPMPTKRLGLAVAVVETLLYAIGGGSTVEPPFVKLNTVEVYDSDKDSWRPRASMIKSRQFFAVVVINTDIYAIGGDSEDEPTMEKFDTARNEWTMVGELRPDGNYRSVAFKNGD